MDFKKLKNYSTSKQKEETIVEIKALFEQIGIEDVIFKCDQEDSWLGILQYIEFRFRDQRINKAKTYRIYANVENVLKALEKQKAAGMLSRQLSIYFAENVSCRNIKDFLHTQVALIKTAIITPGQAFFAFLQESDETSLYEKYVEGSLIIKE